MISIAQEVFYFVHLFFASHICVFAFVIFFVVVVRREAPCHIVAYGCSSPCCYLFLSALCHVVCFWTNLIVMLILGIPHCVVACFWMLLTVMLLMGTPHHVVASLWVFLVMLLLVSRCSLL